MERNALLNACKIEFLRGYSSALEAVLFGEQVRILTQSIQMQSTAPQGGMSFSHSSYDVGQVLKLSALSSIEKLLSRSLQTAYDSFRPSFSMPSSLESLSLVEHSSVEENLRLDEITTRLGNAAEHEVRDLNARIAKIFEQEEIKPRENPFRPYLIARSLVTAIEMLRVEESVARALTSRIMEGLIEVAPTIYSPLNALLENYGIDAHLELRIKHLHSPGLEKKEAENMGQLTGAYSVGQSVSSERLFELMLRMGNKLSASPISSLGVARSGTTEAPSQAMFGWLPQKGVQAETVLRQFFHAADSKGAPNHPMSADFVPQKHDSALIDAVRTLIHDDAKTPMHDVNEAVENRILAQRDNLITQSGNVAEHMVVDIIAMLFEYILGDKLLPIGVRVQLGRMQFLLLKAALTDPTLFSRTDHAACRLLNRIASVASGLQQDEAWAKKLQAEICRVVETILQDEGDDEEVLTRQLQTFEAFIAKDLLSIDEAIARSVQAVEKAEQRSACFSQISGKMASILLHMETDSYLQGFLTGVWSQVIEHAAREDMKKAESLCDLAPKLVWSIYPKISRESRQQLLGMIPGLVTDLRTGLSQAGLGENIQEEVLNWMMGVHRLALRPQVLQGLHEPTLAQIRGEFSVLPLTISAAPGSAAVKLNLQYLEEALQEHKTSLLDLDPLLEPGMLHFPSRHIAPGGQAVSLRLQRGVNIELDVEGHRSPARIVWISPGEERLVLHVDGMTLPTLVSRSTLCNQFVAGHACFVEPLPLCERASQSLLDTIERLGQAEI